MSFFSKEMTGKDRWLIMFSCGLGGRLGGKQSYEQYSLEGEQTAPRTRLSSHYFSFHGHYMNL